MTAFLGLDSLVSKVGVFFLSLPRFEGSFEQTAPAKNLEQALARDKGLTEEVTGVPCPGDGQVQAVVVVPLVSLQ